MYNLGIFYFDTKTRIRKDIFEHCAMQWEHTKHLLSAQFAIALCNDFQQKKGEQSPLEREKNGKTMVVTLFW